MGYLSPGKGEIREADSPEDLASEGGGVADGGVTTAKLADGAVTGAKTSALDGSKITTGTVAVARLPKGTAVTVPTITAAAAAGSAPTKAEHDALVTDVTALRAALNTLVTQLKTGLQP